MNGILPGLLDDPNLTTLSLPALNDVHIAPLRNPAPSRHNQAPLPLELIDNDRSAFRDPNGQDAMPASTQSLGYDAGAVGAVENAGTNNTSSIASRERDAKKPYLAISELVDAPSEHDLNQVQLPSFVSLSVVEKSPTHKMLDINGTFPNKRIRLDGSNRPEVEADRLLLPMPVQKDERNIRPLLPAMVTGLHEPPPSAAILPSMDLDTRPTVQRNAASVSKMQVKDMLLEHTSSTPGRPPEQMLNTPEVTSAELPKSVQYTDLPSAEIDLLTTTSNTGGPTASTAAATATAGTKDKKLRRIRRKWTQEETADLRAGVKKHGIGKWKQILMDPSYTFIERTSIDLKDRYRVFTRPEENAATVDVSHDDETGSVEADPQNGDRKTPSNTANAAGYRQRRKRHPWTREEDSSLLAGVQRYGFQWTDIHNDPTLSLSHRRATDLRDRIRNLYPDGYKHAEARPLRAEVKKAEKAGKKETPAGVLYAPSTQMDIMAFTTSPTTTFDKGDTSPFKRASVRRQTTDGRPPRISPLTMDADRSSETSRPATLRRSKTFSEADPSGITLPSLALDANGDAEGWDNTLPPFINWEA